jgi:hypothetical protein
MGDVMELVVLSAIVGVFTLVAALTGADSRDGDDWSIHPPL